jgi:hypothetical protein
MKSLASEMTKVGGEDDRQYILKAFGQVNRRQRQRGGDEEHDDRRGRRATIRAIATKPTRSRRRGSIRSS